MTEDSYSNLKTTDLTDEGLNHLYELLVKSRNIVAKCIMDKPIADTMIERAHIDAMDKFLGFTQ